MILTTASSCRQTSVLAEPHPLTFGGMVAEWPDSGFTGLIREEKKEHAMITIFHRFRSLERAKCAFGRLTQFVLLISTLSFGLSSGLQAQENAQGSGDGSGASNPLSTTSSIDLKWTRLNTKDGADTDNYWIKGSWGFSKSAKLSYEITYAETHNPDGTRQTGIDNLSLKPIFFLNKGTIGDWKYGTAAGLEVVFDFAKVDPSTGTIKGYGTGSDLISPLFGVSLSKGNTTLVPLVQHYWSFSGPDVNTTGARLIAIQKFGQGWWTKGDIIAPYDWNTSSVFGTAELELGKMITGNIGIYGSLITGFADSALDNGGSINIRFVF